MEKKKKNHGGYIEKKKDNFDVALYDWSRHSSFGREKQAVTISDQYAQAAENTTTRPLSHSRNFPSLLSKKKEERREREKSEKSSSSNQRHGSDIEQGRLVLVQPES